MIDHKVSAEPDVEVIDLDGDEDFVVLGCDGLWDNLTEDDVALTIYTEIKKNPGEWLLIIFAIDWFSAVHKRIECLEIPIRFQ